MEKSECGTSISAAMDELKRFMKSQLEEFKTETENMFAQMKEELKKLAEGDPAKPAQMQNSPQSEPQIEGRRSDPTSRNCILPLDYVRAGSAIAAVSNELKLNVQAEQGRNELIFLYNDRENDKEMEDAGLENSGPRKSRRTVKEPAWMKDYMTVEDAEFKDGARKSRRTVEEQAWMENSMTVVDSELKDHSTVDGRRKSRRTVKEPAWMNDFESGKSS